MSEFNSYLLPSGINCVLKRTHSDVVYAALLSNTGTRNELEKEHGMAHFIEHMLFKGTNKRKPYHINSLLDRVGGDLNAYTSKEETVVHATVLKRDFSKAVDLISDVFYNSTFPQSEIDKERGVIYDEINLYKDSPSEMIFDDFEDILFSGSSLGRNILGSKKSLKSVKTANFKSFVDRNYDTSKTVFIVVGNISFDKFCRVCDKYLSPIPAKSCESPNLFLPEYKPQTVEIKKNSYQIHTILGSRSYGFNDKRRVVLALLSNILGGPSANSRLNLILREKHGLTYGVENNFTAYSDCGVASIYFGCDKDNHEQCLELINQQLDILRDTKVSSLELNRAKKQFMGQLAISADSTENYMLSCGKSFLMYGGIDTVSQSNSKILAITPELVMEVANEVFGKSTLSMLIYK